MVTGRVSDNARAATSESAEAASGPSAEAPGPAGPQNTGNPRITVAFPFSRITIADRGPSQGVLVDLVERLIDQVGSLNRRLDPADPQSVRSCAELAQEATALAEQLRR